MHPVYRLSGIGRPVDPGHPTNRAIALLAGVGLLVGAVRGLVTGAGLIGSGLAGVNAALVVFISWALTRELAPDDDPAAFIAVVLSFAAWWVLGPQAIFVPVALLMAARLVVRTTGKAAERGDSIVLLVVFGAAAWFESWTMGMAGAAAFALDGLLPTSPGQEPRPYHLGMALVTVVVTGIVMSGGIPAAILPTESLGLGLVAGASALLALFHPQPESVGDVDGLRLRRPRVQAGLLLATLATAGVTLDGGVPVTGLGVPWACLAAVLVGRVVGAVRRS